jgi:hypothetical protein
MRTTTNLALDLVIAVAFLVAANPPVVGLAIHEWFGLAFAAAVVAHLLLHWEWTVAATRRLFTGKGRGLRLNYTVDALLFVALTATVLSGLLISRHVLASLGLPAQAAREWRGVHSLAANASIAAMGVHLGLHWNWIALNLPRLLALSGVSDGGSRTRVRRSSGADASCASAARQ